MDRRDRTRLVRFALPWGGFEDIVDASLVGGAIKTKTCDDVTCQPESKARREQGVLYLPENHLGRFACGKDDLALEFVTLGHTQVEHGCDLALIQVCAERGQRRR